MVLPFGLRTSGYRWEEFAGALHFLCVNRLDIELTFHYVDDFLLVAPPDAAVHARANADRRNFEQLCRQLRVRSLMRRLSAPPRRSFSSAFSSIQ